MTSNADYIIGGATDLSSEMQKKHDEEAPLTPTQKWLGEVLAGRIGLQEGARNAKIEHLQTGTPFHPQMSPTGMTGPEISNPFPSRAPGAPAPEMDRSGPVPQMAPNQQQGMFPSAPAGLTDTSTPSAPPMMRLNYPDAAPIPQNQKEYGQLLEGARLMGTQRAPSGQLTYDQRLALQHDKYGPQGIGQLLTQKTDAAETLQTKKGDQSAARLQTRLEAEKAIEEARVAGMLKATGMRTAASTANTQTRTDALRDIATGKDALSTATANLRALTQRAGQLDGDRAKLLAAVQQGLKSKTDPAVVRALKQYDEDISKVRGAAVFHADTLDKLIADPAADNESTETPGAADESENE